MLHVLLPRRSIPPALEAAVRSTRLARDAATGADRVRAEQAYETACQAVRAFVAQVGEEKLPVPKEIEAEGSDAVQGFIDGQRERLDQEADGDRAQPIDEEA